jgi:YD repeat-containing protein
MRIFIISALMFLAQNSFAMVDMQNANFTESWIDIDVPNTGYNLKVERAYNSRTLFNGMFGFGWCSNFETSLEILADGRVKRAECGAGLEAIYAPKGFDQKEVKEGIQKIITAMKKENPRMTSKEQTSLTDKLKFDTGYRDRESERLGIKRDLKDGSIFYNESNNTDKIVFKKDVYVHDLADGSSEKYNRQGQLAYLYDKNGNFIKFDYNKTTLSSATTSTGRKLSFEYTQNGKVKEIRGPAGIETSYKYEKLSDLVYAKNANGEAYQYEYDQLHNMTKVIYPDKTAKTFKYNQDKDWVTELKDRNGCVEKYDYVLSKDDPKNHYSSEVEKKCDGKVVNKSAYNFWFKSRTNNSGVYLSKLSMNVNGVKTEIEYHDVFEKPTVIKKDKETIIYAYNPSGLLKSKKINNQVITFAYNGQNKVAEVHDGKKFTKFTYDKIGNLTYAQNSAGQTVKLDYDSKGRIVKILDQAKRLINIAYDERFGKPKTIERPGVGKIYVSYNNEGQVVKADTKNNDPTVAVQVASAFNNLIDIITPAGVSVGL